MKREATLITIAFILLLTTCGAHLKDVVVSAPGAASTKGVAEDQVEFQERTGGTMSIEDVISWFAYELVSTVTNADDQDLTTQASHLDGIRPIQAVNSGDRSSDTDPYRLRARSQFQAPTLSRPRDARQ